MTENEGFLEPGDAGPAETGEPAKGTFESAAYGWLRHVMGEVEDLQAHLSHIHDTFEEALRELALFVPEDQMEAALARASTRREAMILHPLPPFPGHLPQTEAGDQVFYPGE